jgi:zinc protease
MKQWFGAQLKNSPMELAVVGDLDAEQAVSLANLYFGSLSERPEQVSVTQRPAPKFPVGEKLHLSADTKVAKSLLLVAYPTSDFWDIQRTRRLTILAEVFSERLRAHIREKLGAAYSPYAFNASYRAYPEYGFLQSYMYVDPAKTNNLAAEVLQIAQELKEQGVSRDEFKRALDPSLTRIKDLRQTNTYWLKSVLLGAGRYPQQLEWSRSIESDYRKITAEEINGLAQQYLKNSKAAIVIIDPKGACPVVTESSSESVSIE